MLRRVLQLGDHVGAEDVGFALAAPLVLAADVEIERLRHFGPRIGVLVAAQRFFGDRLDADALDAAGRAGEVLVDELAVQPDGLEDLRAAIALLRGDAHLGHHLEQALADRLDVVLFQFLVAERVGEVSVGQHLPQRAEGQVRIDRAGAVAGQQGEVMHLAGFARFDDQAAARAALFAHQVMVHAAGGQQGRNRHQLGVHAAVGEDQDRDAVARWPATPRAAVRPCGGACPRRPRCAETASTACGS